MHFSTMTPILVLLLAAVVSYAVTRPIGDIRRHVAAVLVSVAMGVLGGVIQGIVQEVARRDRSRDLSDGSAYGGGGGDVACLAPAQSG